MKKLMIAALAVAGMSAFAADANYKAVVEKFQITVKAAQSNAVESIKMKGFAFWDYNATTGLADQPTLVLWNTKDKVNAKAKPLVWKDPANGKEKKITSYYNGYVTPCKFTDLFVTVKKGKPGTAGQGIEIGPFVGYGTGKRTMADKAGATTDLLKLISGSIAGNIASTAARSYGTWKVSFDKSSTKLVLDKGYKMEDVLLKNKVEIVE